jgi:hypothetical protein
MAIKRRHIEVFSLSFLDVISCGFGAIILLLVLSFALEPATLEHITSELTEEIEKINEEREEIIVKSQAIQIELTRKREALKKIQETVEEIENKLEEAENNDSVINATVQARVKDVLQSVLQTLTQEMKNLLSKTEQPIKEDAVIGGIPVDSEYIAFVIDTSGSMLQAAWPTVVKKVNEVLSVYPEVKGIQVVNDMGSYMFPEYAGRWIPDTPSRRREVLRRLSDWNSFSNSSPVEGIEHVVRTFFRKDARISLYVFGDDFYAGSVDKALNNVVQLNKQDITGKSRVRIHTFGFPVYFGNVHLSDKQYTQRKIRFANLMRLLAEQNSGSFVGLTNSESISNIKL